MRLRSLHNGPWRGPCPAGVQGPGQAWHGALARPSVERPPREDLERPGVGRDSERLGVGGPARGRTGWEVG